MSRILTEKAGKGKFGLLTEQDSGFIEPNDIRNKRFVNEVNQIGQKNTIMVEPLVLFVVLQKYGIKNKNGRIYPEHILRREADRYQQVINERSAIGECVPRDTGIFTKNGWKNIQDVKIGEEIFTLNTETNQLEVQKVQRTTDKLYNDDMIHIYNGGSLDMLVTKKHKVVLWDKNDKPYILTAEELFNKIKTNDSKISQSTIKNSGEWLGETPELIEIPNSDLSIDSNLWASFLGVYLTHGYCDETNLVVIDDVKGESSVAIEGLLKGLPFDYTLSNDKEYIIDNKALYNFLKPLGDSNEKYVPQYAKDWSINLLNELLTWMLLGESDNGIIREHSSTSDKLSEDIFEIFLKVSNGANFSKTKQKDVFIDEEVDIDGELMLIKKVVKSKELNVISEITSKGLSLDTRFIYAEKIPFDDNVYCVTVENGTWLMRYNNKISWTHNSDHPESSIISNDRVSHEIKKIWWEGKTLVGEMEIIMSPGFINQGIISCEGDRVANMLRKGIRVGVSSRGVGSLDEIKGELIVQEDFELICWDIVTSPSTPGSYMFNNSSEAKPFMESEVKTSNLLIDKLDRFLLK